MNDRSKKMLKYGVCFGVLGPLLPFLLAILIFILLGDWHFANKLTRLLPYLLKLYQVLGMPALFTGMVFGYYYRHENVPLYVFSAGGVFYFLAIVGFGGVFGQFFSFSLILGLAFGCMAGMFGAITALLLAFIFRDRSKTSELITALD